MRWLSETVVRELQTIERRRLKISEGTREDPRRGTIGKKAIEGRKDIPCL